MLEVAGHAFFPSAMIVGPQFSLRRYQQFTDGQIKYAVSENGGEWVGRGGNGAGGGIRGD